MNISIFGLGYVGAVTAGCLARKGHQVTGVDIHPQKIDAFQEGKPPIIEPGLEEMLREAHQQGRLRATSDSAEAVAQTEVSIVCVGTPSTENGGLELGFVRQVAKEIALSLRSSSKNHVLVFRSTMLPGSTRQLVDEELGDLTAENRVEVLYFPEFLREGSAVKDFLNPSLAVIGTRDGNPSAVRLDSLFGEDIVTVDWNTAEMVKYACNAFHAAKIAFANEIGRLGKHFRVDARAVMTLLCRDTRLNISPAYLKPGNPFGGSCLPKDLRALMHFGRQSGLNLPLLENLIPSNDHHLQNLLRLIRASGQTEIVILGLSFKAQTDDLRESPMVEVAQHLLGRGYQLRIYDPQLNLAALIGSNKRVIDTKMPHLASLLQPDLALAIGRSGLVIVAQRCAELEELGKCLTPHHHLLDINGWPELRQLPGKYEGFCW